MKRKLFLCQCESVEHIFILSVEEDIAFVEIHLASLPFLKRLILAVRYLFGYRGRYGNFDEILLTPSTALELGDSLIEWASGEAYPFQTNDVY